MATAPTLRPELEVLPRRMAHLPVDDRGYVVPWFVQWLDAKGQPAKAGAPGAVPEFRLMDQEHWVLAVRDKRCWVCGSRLGRFVTFVIGPMCAVNRTTSEPPCHHECATWSARNCPFMSRPQMVRREDDFTRKCVDEVAGIMIPRNPGVTLLWTTKRYQVFDDGRGKPLIELGDPERTEWYRLGQSASRADVEASINSGLPLLLAACEQEPTPIEREDARMELRRRRMAITALLPAA